MHEVRTKFRTLLVQGAVLMLTQSQQTSQSLLLCLRCTLHSRMNDCMVRRVSQIVFFFYKSLYKCAGHTIAV